MRVFNRESLRQALLEIMSLLEISVNCKQKVDCRLAQFNNDDNKKRQHGTMETPYICLYREKKKTGKIQKVT